MDGPVEKGRKRPSKGDLILVARQLGYRSAKDAFQVLKNNGVGRKFDPEKYDEYVAILTTHAETLARIMHSLDRNEKNENLKGARAKNIPIDAAKVLRAYGQRPWLIKPVAKDTKGRYRYMDSRVDLREGEEMVYEGVTKAEHLEAIENAMDATKSASKHGVDSGVDAESLPHDSGA